DPALLELMRALTALPRTEVHVVTGRPREIVERWLGHLPVGLHAEHGQWSRGLGASEWRALAHPALEWRRPVLDILNEFATRTPGALVEQKSVSLAWHYRQADPRFGNFQARELLMHLNALLSNVPVEVLSGNKVIEVRPHGVHKGRVVGPVLAAAPAGSLPLALGDDTTDENLFAALPADGLSVHVGPTPSQAHYRLDGVEDARAFLQRLR
ncbi:MAG TPA: trehalose-phosphatase, partial [Myxococcaceae bacterium]|nr:trehalose-phosphatase [Myxococcaceae bacterium]